MRLLIADDHTLFRQSLESLFKAHGKEFQVVGVASTGTEAVHRAAALKPDVVLMDLKMPELDGIEATKQLLAREPEIKVVVLTGSEDEEDLFEALKAGAKGYLQKNLEATQVLALLRGVLDGEPALTPRLARKLLEEFAKTPKQRKDGSEPDALSDREREVLELMVNGTTTNRTLASRLGVSENTIKFHVCNILDKLHLNNRAQLVGYALRHRLV